MKENYNDLFNINPKYSTTAGFILGLILIDNLSASEQNALGEWLVMVGQTILTNSGFQMVIENRIQNEDLNINSKKFKSLYNPIYYNIKNTKDLVKKLYPSFKDEIDKLSELINNLENQLNSIKKE